MTNRYEKYTPEQIALAETHRPLVRAAGLDSPAYDAGQLYMLGSTIIHDEVVTRRAAAEPVGGFAKETIDVVNEMTDEEKDELAQRLARQWGLKVVRA